MTTPRSKRYSSVSPLELMIDARRTLTVLAPTANNLSVLRRDLDQPGRWKRTRGQVGQQLRQLVSTTIRQSVLAAVIAFFVVWGLEGFRELDPVAIATIILASATFYMAQHAAEQLQISRLELNASQRPVIVPTVLSSVTDGPAGRGAQNRIVVPIKNVGRGPAINIDVSCMGDDFPTSIGENHPVLGTNEEVDLLFLSNGGQTIHPFAVTIVYDDLAGQFYRTTAHWDSGVGSSLYTEIQSEGPLATRPDLGEATSAHRFLIRALRPTPRTPGPTARVADPDLSEGEPAAEAQAASGHNAQGKPTSDEEEEKEEEKKKKKKPE